MYVIPLAVLLVLGLVAVAWNPIFALIAFAIFMLGFFAFIGMSRRSDEEVEPAQQLPNQGPRHEDDQDTGLWGERRAS